MIVLKISNEYFHIISFHDFFVNTSNTPGQDTVVIHSEEDFNGIEIPAITIDPIHAGFVAGWKSPRMNYDQTFSMFDHCEGFNNMSDCMKNDTFEKEDFLNSLEISMLSVSANENDKFSPSFKWSEDLTVPSMGRHYTLTSSSTIRPTAKIIVNLANKYDYQIWVHDENFFIPNNNPFGPPSQQWRVNKGGSRNPEGSKNYTNTQNSGVTKTPGQMHRITLTKQKKLNLPRSPCNEDPVYSFTTCVKEQLSQRIGCRLPWDKWSDQSRRTCESENEFKQFEKNYTNFGLAEFYDILEDVGCLKPCAYNEFKFVSSSPVEVPELPDAVILWPASKRTQIEEEVLLYPFTSFLAEFGGALGLFLGFSFLTIWQEIKSCLVFVCIELAI